MVITCLTKTEYGGTNVYVMQFHLTFQYMFVWEKKIYQDHFEVIPELWRLWAWRLGIIHSPYTQDMMDGAKEAALSGAMTSIDKLMPDNKDGAKSD